ncbi:ankyrin repeat-containing domain protein [Aspergillus pseudotamarii]|uniref:Ankyrin repeat-containing domain protein n=1 Tax=Aspergillus pseudotamarii TaxID=132259 RepID=A0A5N6T984_ASPPS|nr:ankyrin repeat-containing domain protein [Aspergillus pseudotamarii]KAE8142846.1 ankyrin repeat-containing domain protein [Aspergillus pseudotamarii]
MLLTDLPSELIQRIIYFCDNGTIRSIMAVSRHLQQNVLAVLKPEFQKQNFGLCKSLEEYEICRLVEKDCPHGKAANMRVITGDVAGLKQYLEWGLDLRHFAQGGCSLLSLIMCTANPEIPEYLFSNGHITAEDVFTVAWLDDDVVTLGSAVILAGSSDSVIRFVDLAGSDMVASLNKASMFVAIRRLSAGALKCLIEVGLPLTIREDITNNTVLHAALGNMDASAVLELILPLTPELYNEANADNLTVLGQAIMLQSMYAVRTLLKVDGISPSSNGHPLSPLYIAVCKQNAEMVLLLIKRGADPNDGRGTIQGTALHAAVGNLYTDIFDRKAHLVFNLLLENGGDIEVPDLYGVTSRNMMNRLVFFNFENHPQVMRRGVTPIL